MSRGFSWRVGRLGVREAAELVYVQRVAMYEVAKRAGVTYECLRRAFLRYQIPLPGKGIAKGSPINVHHFQRARARGWSKRRLARHLGIHHTRLIREQARLGFSWPERDGYRGPGSS